MKERTLPVILLVFLGLVVINLMALDVLWLRSQKPQSKEKNLSPLTSAETGSSLDDSVTAAVDTCGPICQQLIGQRVAELGATLSGKERTTPTPVTPVSTGSTSQPTVIYIPLGGGGSTTSRDWADVGNAEIYLDVTNYPNLDKAYFEAFIRVQHGNGTAFARLYDVTHNIGVQGGEVSTGSESFALVESGSLNFWQGKNLYRVQVKSLTGYEAFYDSGRIKLILK